MAVNKKAAGTKTPKAASTRTRKVVDKTAPAVEVATAEEAPRVEVAAVPVSEAVPPAHAAPVASTKPAAPKKARTARYLLPGNMEIAALGPVHAELVEMEASNDGPFVLDGANLSVIDTAGLQLLISFVSSVKSSGRKVSWDNYSVQAYQLANELGVVDQLGD